jgi:hypothetical protein
LRERRSVIYISGWRCGNQNAAPTRFLGTDYQTVPGGNHDSAEKEATLSQVLRALRRVRAAGNL